MIRTTYHLIEDLESYIDDCENSVPRNTTACTNWHMTTCAFRDVCRQGSREAEQATLNNGFLKLPIWDTEAVQPTTF